MQAPVRPKRVSAVTIVSSFFLCESMIYDRSNHSAVISGAPSHVGQFVSPAGCGTFCPLNFATPLPKPLIHKTYPFSLWTWNCTSKVTWGEVTRRQGATLCGGIMKKLVLLFLIATVTVAAHADPAKLSPELQGLTSTQKVQVIVQYAPGTQLNCNGLLGLVDCLVNDVVKLGGTILADLPLINGIVAQLDGNAIQSLSNQSNVVYISTDRPLTPSLSSAAVAVNAPFAWQSNFTGAGIGVALIDSGVSNHPDLNLGILPLSRVVYQQSFVPGNSSANDQYGHGTHVAGLIAGDGLDSTGPLYTKTFKGIAPGASIINLRVLDANGAGTDSLVIAAINQAIAMKSRYNIRVINLSLGRAVYESYTLDPLCQAVEQPGKMESWWLWPRVTTAATSPLMVTPPSPRPATIRM